jgi:hypothetical protein
MAVIGKSRSRMKATLERIALIDEAKHCNTAFGLNEASMLGAIP